MKPGSQSPWMGIYLPTEAVPMGAGSNRMRGKRATVTASHPHRSASAVSEGCQLRRGQACNSRGQSRVIAKTQLGLQSLVFTPQVPASEETLAKGGVCQKGRCQEHSCQPQVFVQHLRGILEREMAGKSHSE